MAAPFYFLVFIVGLFFGSFLNLISDRITKKQPIILGRSKCDFCKKTLKPKNLIPLLSYILQKGKCSFCHKKLSLYYPFSEILVGVFFVLAAYLSQWRISSFLYLCIVLSFYAAIFLTDLKHLIIPDKIVWPAILFVLLYSIGIYLYRIYQIYTKVSESPLGKYLVRVGYLRNQILWESKSFGLLIVSAAAIGLFFLLLIAITKGRGMGGGDVKLGLLIGLFNGFPYNVLGVFLGFVAGSLVSILLIVMKKKTMKDIVPFGPFLIVGSIISLVWGRAILNWYIGFMG